MENCKVNENCKIEKKNREKSDKISILSEQKPELQNSLRFGFTCRTILLIHIKIYALIGLGINSYTCMGC